MSHAREANMLGTLALAVADRVRAATEDVAPHGASAPAALVALHEFLGTPTIDELARVLGLTHSGTVRLVDRLCAAGLLERTRTSDPRARALRLTDAGDAAAVRIRDARIRAVADFLAPLPAERRAVFADLLASLLEPLAVDRPTARRLCRMCDVHACGHDEGTCPVTEGRKRSAAATK
jgi:MarR family transcriptional regulator, negative regulator of the multidrug operon emrRAB